MNHSVYSKDIASDPDEVGRRIRRRILSVIWRARASHLGTSFSVVDILVAIYSSVNTDLIKSGSQVRDRVLLSKGHGAAALYCTLEEFKLLSREQLDSYHKSGSNLTGHVSHKVPGVEHSTGALGHGFSVAIGMALALKHKGSNSRVYCVVGDGEIQEGSIWEAVMLWRHLNLTNLTLLVDDNEISSIGQTRNVINMDPLDKRFGGFGLNCINVNGHDGQKLLKAIDEAKESISPTVIICRTVKGKGASFAEGQPIWHYKTLDDALYSTAMDELGEGER
jgi:transketolase